MSDLLDGAPRGAQNPSLRFLLNWYDVCLRYGTKPSDLAKLYGKSKTQIIRWIDNYKHLRVAAEVAQEKRDANVLESEDAKNTLSDEAYEIWDEIQRNSSRSLVFMGDALAGRPTKIRQQLFLMAMMKTNYRTTESCRLTGVTRAELNKWRQSDPDFLTMFTELYHLREEEVEGALNDLVREKNVAAVIHAHKDLKEKGTKGKGLYEADDIITMEQLEGEISVETVRELLRAMQAVGVTSNYKETQSAGIVEV